MIQERFLFVLVTLIIFIILPPFLEGFAGLRLVIDIFFTAIFISVILAIGESERDTRMVLLLSGPLFVLVWMTHLVDLPAVVRPDQTLHDPVFDLCLHPDPAVHHPGTAGDP